MDHNSEPTAALARLRLAGRESLAGLHPLHDGGLVVADCPAHLDVRRAIAAHARLGEPRRADFEVLGGFFGRQQDGNAGDRAADLGRV
jgi:hypothetical protein